MGCITGAGPGLALPLGMLAVVGPASAGDRGDRVDRRMDPRGECIDQHRDRHGDRIDRRSDRRQ